MAENAKERLVEFLEDRAFTPVLNADLDAYPESKHDALRDVQEATRAERERFHHYGSAREVYEMYKDDLSSEPAKKVSRKLRELDLPTLNDCRSEFEQLAEEVGVR